MLDTRTPRDRLPTLPCDLSEFARDNTGPLSWSTHPNAELLSSWALGDPASASMTELLSEIGPDDVPRVVAAPSELSPREAAVVSAIDGRSTLERMVDTIDLPAGELLEIVCSLCARGLIVLDRPA